MGTPGLCVVDLKVAIAILVQTSRVSLPFWVVRRSVDCCGGAGGVVMSIAAMVRQAPVDYIAGIREALREFRNNTRVLDFQNAAMEFLVSSFESLTAYMDSCKRQLQAGRANVGALREDVEREARAMERMALELNTLRDQVDRLQGNATYQDYRIALLEQAAPTQLFDEIA